MRNLLQGVAVFFERTAAIELRKFELWQQVSVEEGQWTELTTIIKGKENKERVKIEVRGNPNILAGPLHANSA